VVRVEAGQGRESLGVRRGHDARQAAASGLRGRAHRCPDLDQLARHARSRVRRPASPPDRCASWR
jgi:hypothetical protein